MKNTKFILSWHGGHYALGIEATTPITGDVHADSKAARAAITTAANGLYNYGAYDGGLHYMHDRFAYIVTSEAKLRHCFEGLLIADNLKRRYELTDDERRASHAFPADMKTTRALAAIQFKELPRENFLLGQSDRNERYSPHYVEGKGQRVMQRDHLQDA